MKPLAQRGVVRSIGNWLELSFPHDLRVTDVLRRVGGRRVALGEWRVPLERLSELVRGLEPFGFEWDGEAGRLHTGEIRLEADLRREDSLALMVKAGEPTMGSWSSPVGLFPHQRTAAEFLAVRSGALLCDEQGLGKTLSALVAFWLLRQRGKVRRLLVICPNSLKHTWQTEVAQFFPEWRVTVVGGYKRSRQRAYEQSADVYVVNYEAARSDHADLRILLRRAPTVLVCDESHATKNAGSRTAWSLAFIRSAARSVWLMSGTPITNRVEDCYAQVAVADGGRSLGTKDAFLSRYVRRMDQGAARADLTNTLAPILLRRTKEEVLDLPEKIFETRYVELKGEQREIYDAIRRNLYAEIKSMPQDLFERSMPNVLTRLLRLVQVAANPRLVYPDFQGDTAKAKEIDGLLEDLIMENGRKVVLWSHYVRTIEEFLERYGRFNPVAVYGAIDTPRRADAVRRFQQDPSVMLFIGNPQAAGTGLTLTAAHYAIYETLSWRYDLYAQSVDRTHRIGQDRNVTYLRVLAWDTIDLDIVARLKSKEELAADILGDRDRATRYSKDEVLAMLSRRSRG